MNLNPGKKPPYTIETDNSGHAEINLYGEIVESRPYDLWTGELVEGDYIVQNEFMKDLEQIAKANSITVRINSLGGDAGVAILIHNRLRELAAKGAKLNCIIDGVAMSGGSLIMCACDHVSVNPSSLIMLHKCWTLLFGGYNADELRSQAEQQDAWDKAQISVYKRKSGLSETVIAHMMSDTTYMTGAEAVEKGFADEVLQDVQPLDIAASADGRSLFVRGRQFHLTPGMFAPDSIPTVAGRNQNERGNRSMASTIEELRKEYPELTAQLEAEARAAAVQSAKTPPQQAESPSDTPVAGGGSDRVQAERQRIQEIDKIAPSFDEDTVWEAKYGEHPCTAQEMAYQAAQKASQQGKAFLTAMQDDFKASGAQNVTSTPTGSEEPSQENKTPEQRMNAARAEVKALFGKETK